MNKDNFINTIENICWFIAGLVSSALFIWWQLSSDCSTNDQNWFYAGGEKFICMHAPK